MTNEANLAGDRVSQVAVFQRYQELLEEKGFDEKGVPIATLQDLQESFPTLKPDSLKQKVYNIRTTLAKKGKTPPPMLPTGLPRKKRVMKGPKVEDVLVEMLRAREVFNQVD